jgi:hypothetical protein
MTVGREAEAAVAVAVTAGLELAQRSHLMTHLRHNL